ncbi:MAG: polysaccharide pyruvyl transferase family protein [Candidatus Eisenbacteria bacterium]
MKPPRRIGILGHVGNGNLGDEAIIDALLRGVRGVIPEAEFIALTIRPADTEARHRIPSFPLRRGLAPAPTAPSAVVPASSAPSASSGVRSLVRRIPGLGDLLAAGAAALRWIGDMAGEAAFWGQRFRLMRRVDLLIVAGSNQLSDYYGGPWGFPYTLWAWSAAARLAGARVAFLSVGAGPIRARSSGLLIRMALALSSYRSYRDAGSRDAIAAIRVPGPHVIAPDLAHGLRPAAPSGAMTALEGARLIVINPLPYFDPRSWAERDAGVYQRYVDTMAEFAVALRARGYRVRFVPTQLRADPLVIADILRAIERSSGTAEELTPLAAVVSNFEDLVAHLSEANIVVAARFHGVLISQMLGKPTIGIVYRRSTRDLLVDVGQGAYAIDIEEMTATGLLERLSALERDSDAGDRIQRRLEEYRRELEAQYAVLLGTNDTDHP